MALYKEFIDFFHDFWCVGDFSVVDLTDLLNFRSIPSLPTLITLGK